ncbi:MAG: hypothetical protein Q9168_008174 [Polycauliona sp. 1 TL-2023]
MHYVLPLLASLLGAASATPLEARAVQGFDFPTANAPGPIPFSDGTTGGGWPIGVDNPIVSQGGGATDGPTQAILADCLTKYSEGDFYNSWLGMNCGGVGWFKGSTVGVDPYHCYQACAPFVLANGIKESQKSATVTYRVGLKGKCWMGYN